MPTLDDIRQAARDLEGRIHRTPMLTSSALNERFGADLVLKAELFQKTGSFKVRGLLTKLLRLSAAERERGVITVSAGNAAGALACCFVAHVVPAGSDPDAWLATWFAETLAPLSPFSLREATRVARVGSGLSACLEGPLADAERAYVERLLPSHDGNEGIEAFLAKRAPSWTGS